MISRVAIVGGTHGNELIGAWLVRRFEKQPHALGERSFEPVLVLGNPEALKQNRRYVDVDLTRSFGEHDPSRPGYEAARAAALKEQLGRGGTAPADVLIDLHTTTANMGLSLILVNRDPFALKLAAWVQQRNPKVRVYLWIDETLPDTAMTSIVQRGITIEVGAIANGIVRADLFIETEQLLKQCLDFIDAHNRGELTRPLDLECFVHIESRDYPRDADGEPCACIHPELQDRDFEALRPGDPIFLTLGGETLRLQTQQPVVYPVFINEAAYYEKGIAFSLTRRERLSV
jgi:aspartoacylase